MFEELEGKKYGIVYADPPWFYKTQGKNGGAANHYDLMDDETLKALPVRKLYEPKCAVFMWVTGPRLDMGIDTLRSWDLHYRGMAFVWVKTRADGKPIGAKGGPPAFVKSVTEFVIVGTTIPSGRVWPLMNFKQRQVLFEPVSRHSAKPWKIRRAIEKLAPEDTPKIELFARERFPGWDCWGNENV